jgi:hypothetical protein
MKRENTLQWLLNLQESLELLSNLENQKSYWIDNNQQNDIVSSFDETYYSLLDIFFGAVVLDNTYFSDYELDESLKLLVNSFLHKISTYYGLVNKNYYDGSMLLYHKRIIEDKRWHEVVDFANILLKSIKAELSKF